MNTANIDTYFHSSHFMYKDPFQMFTLVFHYLKCVGAESDVCSHICRSGTQVDIPSPSLSKHTKNDSNTSTDDTNIAEYVDSWSG